jgi:excisionase family DNA binding protein
VLPFLLFPGSGQAALCGRLPSSAGRGPDLTGRAEQSVRRPGPADGPPPGERPPVRHRAADPAPLGGSNRLLSVDELAAYLGVPKKTVYGCWREWGLRGYRVGRYLRFRERHVEEWLRNQEA